MSGWPWMKGIEVALAEPVPRTCVEDERHSALQVIAMHRSLVDQVKSELASTDPLYDPTKHDDLWIVRFLLSHKKNPKDALKAAKATLLFRKQHKLDETGDIRAFPPHHRDSVPIEAVRRYMNAGVAEDAVIFVVPDPQRGVIAFLDMVGIDQHKLVEAVDEADWLPAFLYMSEWSFQWVDYVTRTTGLFTKSIRLADTHRILLGGINKENQRRDGKVMGIMEDCYPQMLHGIFVCNAPAWVQVPWRILRPLMPKRVVEKIDFINPLKNEKERKRLYKHIAPEHLPEKFGGKNQQWPVDFPPPVEDSSSKLTLKGSESQASSAD